MKRGCAMVNCTPKVTRICPYKFRNSFLFYMCLLIRN